MHGAARPQAMRSRLLLARHGETDSNVSKRYAGRGPEGLTDRGRAQVADLARQLHALGTTDLRIRCSSLPRALESASIIGRALALDPEVDPRLDELGLGPWEGLTEDEVRRRFPSEYALWDTNPDLLRLKGRETLDELSHRVLPVAHEASATGTHTLLVTHVAPIRVIILSALGQPLGLYRRLAVANAECFAVDLVGGSVKRMSETSWEEVITT